MPDARVIELEAADGTDKCRPQLSAFDPYCGGNTCKCGAWV
jgi:hypothetical protein